MNSISFWQEYISALNDEKFSRLMRLYLGDIKTPFNKLKLTEQLASFIRTPEHTKNFLSLIDETDLKFLTAINMVPAMTHEKLEHFFGGEFSLPELYTIIANLTERLLIYPMHNDVLDQDIYKINPFLETEISRILDPKLIFPESTTVYSNLDADFALSPNFLAAFISYIRMNGISVKADGTFKKTDNQKLEEIFGDKYKRLQFILNGFLNLSILRDDGKKLTFDEKALKSFSVLPQIQQYALLCTASSIRLGTNTLGKQVQLLLDTSTSLENHCFSKDVVLRISQVIASRSSATGDTKSLSRFSRLLSQVQATSTPDTTSSTSIIEDIFDAAVAFGFFSEKGKTEDGEPVYTSGPLIYTRDFDFGGSTPKVVNINATSSVTLLPGLGLSSLLPFTKFLQIVKCSTVSEFEITKKSASYAFDKGLSVEQISEILSGNANFQIPANLLFNLNEWYSAYSSAMLFRGYILKVSKENIVLTENNPNIASHIKEKLADNIYLLDIPIDKEPTQFIKESGLDFMATVKSIGNEYSDAAFPSLKPAVPFFIEETSNDTEKLLLNNARAQDALKKELNGYVEERQIDNYHKETLQMRISNRLIVSKNQLATTSIRSEILEANGMDYQGKVHLIEAAIKESELLELQLPSPTDKGRFFSVLARPLMIVKQEGDAVIRVEIEPSKEQDSILVSKITHVRRIRR